RVFRFILSTHEIMVVFQSHVVSLAVWLTPAWAEPDSSFVRMESMRGEAMTGTLLSGDGLVEAENRLNSEIEEMQQNATAVIEQRAEKIEEYLQDTEKRYLHARSALSSSLASLASSVAARWRRLSVSSFHERLGKCCCPGAATGCEWQAFELGGPLVDYECKAGFADYLDVLDMPNDNGVALSRSPAVDAVLDQCASKGWPYPAMDWSPPVRNLSAFDAVVPTPLTLVPTEPAEPQVVTVEVPDVVDQEEIEPTPSSPSPPKDKGTTLDIDLDTLTDDVTEASKEAIVPKSVQIVQMPEPVTERPENLESQSQGKGQEKLPAEDELARAAQELAAAEQVASGLPSTQKMLQTAVGDNTSMDPEQLASLLARTVAQGQSAVELAHTRSAEKPDSEVQRQRSAEFDMQNSQKSQESSQKSSESKASQKSNHRRVKERDEELFRKSVRMLNELQDA
ncbi:unnamed protein product, partial [Effrenium voratum]